MQNSDPIAKLYSLLQESRSTSFTNAGINPGYQFVFKQKSPADVEEKHHAFESSVLPFLDPSFFAELRRELPCLCVRF